MENLFSKSIYHSLLKKAALLAAMAFCGTLSPVWGQEAVTGKFTLHENTRLGDNVLPSGSYLFTIEPTGNIQSLGSVSAVGSPVLFHVRPEKRTGPSAAVIAMASPSDQALDASQLVLKLGKNEAAMHTMYLDKEKLRLEFDWSSSKDKAPITAQAEHPQGSSSSKSTD
jgi:hypothetical protein